MSLPFLRHERHHVALLLDALDTVEGARMVRDDGIGHLGIDDAHALVARDDRQRPLQWV
jgi:hypothetical protein